MKNLLKTFNILHICLPYNKRKVQIIIVKYCCYRIVTDVLRKIFNDMYISCVEESTSLCIALYELAGQTNRRNLRSLGTFFFIEKKFIFDEVLFLNYKLWLF